MTQTLLVLGGVTFDSLIYLGGLPEPVPQTVFSTGFHEAVGGTGAGKALNLNRLGFDVTLHALIGDDPQGAVVRALFEGENLNFVYDLDAKGTERHVNLMAGDGTRISIYVNYATFEPKIDADRVHGLVEESDLVVLNIINYCRHLIPEIKQAGSPIWCDIHDYDGANSYHQDFIDAADVLFLSSDGLADYRAFMSRMIDEGKQLVICTHGSEGSTALTASGEWIGTAIAPYNLVDSNGAGDSFFAGVLYGHSQAYAIQKCLQLGAVTAGLCITSSALFSPSLHPAKVEAERQRIFGD